MGEIIKFPKRGLSEGECIEIACELMTPRALGPKTGLEVSWDGDYIRIIDRLGSATRDHCPLIVSIDREDLAVLNAFAERLKKYDGF